MKDLIIEFAALIYPSNFNKQKKLEIDMLIAGHDRLDSPTVESFRSYYELHGCVPLTPDHWQEDMEAIMFGRTVGEGKGAL